MTAWAEVPGQLGRFASVLRRQNETRPTADYLLSQSGKFEADWNASRTLTALGIPLPLPRDQGIHPVGSEIQACYLNARFKAAPVSDEPIEAEFQVKVEGLLLAGDAMIELEDHWRIDTDVHATAGGKGNSEGREPHPCFHFQRGGHAQDEFAAAHGFIPGAHTNLGDGPWKALMQYPGPRIASLPFDPILALDFCIAQNDGPLWRRLRDIPEYFTVVEEAQERLWRPFCDTLSTRDGRRRWLGGLAVV